MDVEKIITLTDDKYHYTAGYYVTNKWIDNETFIGVRFKETVNDNELIKISLKNMDIDVIDRNILCAGFSTVYNGNVFYNDSKGVVEMNVNSGTKRRICVTDATAFQMTTDGKFASVFVENDEPNRFYRIDIEKGEIEKLYDKMFNKPFNVANHFMISPTDKDIFFFAHEGSTFYVSNRLWIYDAKTGNERNIAKQRLDKDGNVGDCFGHEMWAPDGKGLYFVKYSCSPIKPCGICYVDIKSGEYELLYSKYKYWHVGVSADGRFLTADTQYAPHQSEVVVIDRENGIESVVDMPYMTGVHPCHPHPQLSPDNSKVIYTALDKEDGRTCIKIAYLKD